MHIVFFNRRIRQIRLKKTIRRSTYGVSDTDTVLIRIRIYTAGPALLVTHVRPNIRVPWCVTAKRKGRRKAEEETRKETRKEGEHLD